MTGVTTSSWMPLLWFSVVLVLIPAALWLLKRSGLAPAGMRGASAGPRLTGSLALGPQQRVVTVEVGEGDERRWLVLGVTAQQITTLHTLTAPPLGAPAPLPRSGASQPPAGFSQLLAKALRTGSGQPGSAQSPRAQRSRAAGAPDHASAPVAAPVAASASPITRRPRPEPAKADHVA